MICTSCGKQYNDSSWERNGNTNCNVVNGDVVHLCEDCYTELYAILEEPFEEEWPGIDFADDLEE